MEAFLINFFLAGAFSCMESLERFSYNEKVVSIQAHRQILAIQDFLDSVEPF